MTQENCSIPIFNSLQLKLKLKTAYLVKAVAPHDQNDVVWSLTWWVYNEVFLQVFYCAFAQVIAIALVSHINCLIRQVIIVTGSKIALAYLVGNCLFGQQNWRHHFIHAHSVKDTWVAKTVTLGSLVQSTWALDMTPVFSTVLFIFSPAWAPALTDGHQSERLFIIDHNLWLMVLGRQKINIAETKVK